MREFRLHRPDSILGASQLLREYGENAMAYAGGTEVVVLMKLGLTAPEHLVDLKYIPDLARIRVEDEGIRIGATATHRDIETSATVNAVAPALCAMESRVANVRVRNTGTLAGNLCFADPHSDPATLLALLDAQLALSGVDGERVVRFRDFTVGSFMTGLAEGELVREVYIPIDGRTVAYERYCHAERPSVGVAMACRCDSTRQQLLGVDIAVGAACATPCVMTLSAEAAPMGLLEDIVQDGMNTVLDSIVLMEEDGGLSKSYKRQLVRALALRAVDSIIR